VKISTPRLQICPINKDHLKFLLKLWNDAEIMRYAGFARNWKYKDVLNWYQRYLKNIKKYGTTEMQFVIKLKNGRLIGESGVGRLRKRWSCPGYNTAKNKIVCMSDVKLLKKFWNNGYGTEAMKAIVKYVFTKTRTDIFLVPPHKDNIPAIRVYEKAGFKKTKGLWYRYHYIYEMKKENYN